MSGDNFVLSNSFVFYGTMPGAEPVFIVVQSLHVGCYDTEDLLLSLSQSYLKKKEKRKKTCLCD